MSLADVLRRSVRFRAGDHTQRTALRSDEIMVRLTPEGHIAIGQLIRGDVVADQQTAPEQTNPFVPSPRPLDMAAHDNSDGKLIVGRGLFWFGFAIGLVIGVFITLAMMTLLDT